MENKDYYHILGLQPNATSEQIKEAYRRLAFEYHPDRNQNDATRSDMMKHLNEAYAVLSNPAKRREYDVLRQNFGRAAHGHFRQTYSQDDIFRGSDINAIFEDMARMYGLRGFRDIFSEFYGPAFQKFEFYRPGLHVRGFVFRGWRNRFRPESQLPQGRLARIAHLGRLLGLLGPQAPAAVGKDMFDTIEIPPQLADSGGRRHYYLQHAQRELLITIPPGIHEGQQIRLAGMGEPGRAGGAPGDFYLRVRIIKPWWRRLLDWLFSFKGP